MSLGSLRAAEQWGVGVGGTASRRRHRLADSRRGSTEAERSGWCRPERPHSSCPPQHAHVQVVSFHIVNDFRSIQRARDLLCNPEMETVQGYTTSKSSALAF
eukprot:2113370-Rhodomonas_salina.1